MNLILQISNLHKHFRVQGTSALFGAKALTLKAVDGVSFDVAEGETFGLVGESGCGKTTLAKIILLIEAPTEGLILFEGSDIHRLKGEALRRYRTSVQAVFQDPYASLSPRMRVWEIVTEPLIVSEHIGGSAARSRAIELLQTVGLAREAADLYPHQFSGGQRQRIAIARALSSNPRLIVLDEPVSSLDVSIRAQIMNLLKDLQKKFGLTFLLIAHDLAVVRYMSDRIGVMYLGEMVEQGPADRVCGRPLHPYTQALLTSALPFDPDAPPSPVKVSGEPPSPTNIPPGCRFHPRCPKVLPVCSRDAPIQRQVEPDHLASCHLY